VDHRLEPIRSNLQARFSAAAAPVLVVDSGDVVSFATPDVSVSGDSPMPSPVLYAGVAIPLPA
jgi:hypothetical protein